ncbi:MAG: hypothetical protein EPN86_03095 [Nanoarchaeota archaeon]|nr:MAG: hypothetical protein EPN86_03095 [Nanoarchaeota archaeon]
MSLSDRLKAVGIGIADTYEYLMQRKTGFIPGAIALDCITRDYEGVGTTDKWRYRFYGPIFEISKDTVSGIVLGAGISDAIHGKIIYSLEEAGVAVLGYAFMTAVTLLGAGYAARHNYENHTASENL